MIRSFTILFLGLSVAYLRAADELKFTDAGPVIVTTSTNQVTRARLEEWIVYHRAERDFHQRKIEETMKMLADFDRIHAVKAALFAATNVYVSPPPLPTNGPAHH